MNNMSKKQEIIGLIDADLLDNGTRHPNLVLLKLAGFFHDNGIPFELILDPQANTLHYTRIYLSCVFTFTKLPELYIRSKGTPEEKKFKCGGTGFYANEVSVMEYRRKREQDMNQLEHDEFLNTLRNFHGGKEYGISMSRQMPYYHLYDQFINQQVKKGFKREKFKDYQKYSIGFLTRGCVRHCPFCVNKLENCILPYSKLQWFLDDEKDKNGKLVRPYIYLWDDNFLASDPSIWRPLLKQLIETKRPFQFRQGLDERMLAESPYGEEMAEMLSRSRYHGDFIFAFDNWKDHEIIEKSLKIWKRYNPKKGTKFYLFCGFKQSPTKVDIFYKDIWELFQRIKILMQYGCVGYVMRHEDYHNAPVSNFYVQIARWCNQQQFYKKMSFWQFCYRNQSYWEEKTLKITTRPKLKTNIELNIKSDNSQYDVYKLLSKELSKITKVDYDYIIIDEAQDVIDKGVDIVLNELLSSQHNGLKQGRYLVFYDLEQGYNNVSRNLNENINKIAKYAACFILDENKRVPTNKLIVEYANKVLSVEHCQEAFELYLDSLKGNDIAGLTISFHDNVREVKKTIKEHTKHLFQYCGEISSTTLLIHSDFKYKENEDDDSVYDIIAEMESFLEVLSEKTIERKSKELLAFTTILKYKGLEDNNIILVIPASKIKSSWDNFLFEIYVGMTRAIMNLDIIILKSN